MKANELGELVDDYGRTEKQIYSEIEPYFGVSKNFGKSEEEAEKMQEEYYFIEDDANQLLANIGLDQNMDLSSFPREQLFRIFRYYQTRSEKNVNGKIVFVDPLPDYKAGEESFDKEMFKFGYELGKGGRLGIYYRLLPNNQFREGYWVGKMERYVELNDDDTLRELSREIKVYDATKSEEEMELIVNNIFKEEEAVQKR